MWLRCVWNLSDSPHPYASRFSQALFSLFSRFLGSGHAFSDEKLRENKWLYGEDEEGVLQSELGFMGLNRRVDKAGQVLHRQKLGSLLWWLGVARRQSHRQQVGGGHVHVVVWLCSFAFLSRSIHPSINVSVGLQTLPEETRKQTLGLCECSVGCRGSERPPSPSSVCFCADWLGGVRLGWLCHLPTCPVLLFQGRFYSCGCRP